MYYLTTLTIPNGIKTIGNSAFYQCGCRLDGGMNKIILSNCVESIGESAFNKSKVTEVVIPDSGYQLKSLKWYTTDPTSATDITSAKSFTMPAANVTVTAEFEEKPTPPSSGSSTTITVPVSGDGDSVKVSATVSGSSATVQEIKDADLAKVAGRENVEIDLTGLNKNIDTAKLPTATVEKISEQSGMSVKLSTATVTFDKTATREISDQANGSTVELVVDDIREVSLNAVQKEAVKKLDTALIIDAHLVSGGTKLCTEGKGGFGGGKATVTLSYEIKNNRTAANYSVYYVDDAGKLEKLVTRYDAKLGAFVFDITHFSNYVVAYDEYTMAFADVLESDYFFDAVKWAAKNDITTGTSTTAFSPNAPVTRAQVVTFLWRAAGCPEATHTAAQFQDVSPNAYYVKAVEWALSKGITKGTSDTAFSPDAVCTRGQIVTFLARFAGVEDSETASAFTDVKTTDYFAAAVKWAKDNGVTEGTSAATFSPNTDCTRAQVVTFLYRYMVR